MPARGRRETAPDPYIFFGAELQGMISGGVTVRWEPPWCRAAS
jgi:hypothetical protein